MLARFTPHGPRPHRHRLPGDRGLPRHLRLPQGQPRLRGPRPPARRRPGDRPESPLLVPTKAAGEASRTTRLLRFSPRTGKVTAEYAYQFAPVSVVDPGQTNPAELKISSIVGIGPNTVLVQERTDRAARLYLADLRKATNLLGGRYDNPATSPSLEQDASPVTVPRRPWSST